MPGDESQVMYVWFDALAIYITGVGYGIDDENFKKWWPADVHVIGKDINRFHTVYWPAMLTSAGLPIPKVVLVHGFVHSGGAKMSKTTGNVIDPFEVSEKYGLEPFRYFMLSQIPTLDDGDFTNERFLDVYNADLANGLGNLVARVARLCEKIELDPLPDASLTEDYKRTFEDFKFNEVLANIWKEISEIDVEINETKPWTVEDLDKLKELLQDWVIKINQIAFELKPFLPETSEKIQEQFKGPRITSGTPLFPRIK